MLGGRKVQNWKGLGVLKCFPTLESSIFRSRKLVEFCELEAVTKSQNAKTSTVSGSWKSQKCSQLRKVPKFRKCGNCLQPGGFGNPDICQLEKGQRSRKSKVPKIWNFGIYYAPPQLVTSAATPHRSIIPPKDIAWNNFGLRKLGRSSEILKIWNCNSKTSENPKCLALEEVQAFENP